MEYYKSTTELCFQFLNQWKLQLLPTHKIKRFYETKISEIAIVNGLIK